MEWCGRRTPHYKCKSHMMRAAPRGFETVPLENPLDEPPVAETAYGPNGCSNPRALDAEASSNPSMLVRGRPCSSEQFREGGDRIHGSESHPAHEPFFWESHTKLGPYYIIKSIGFFGRKVTGTHALCNSISWSAPDHSLHCVQSEGQVGASLGVFFTSTPFVPPRVAKI